MPDPVTWEDDVKHFFTQMDVGCMRARALPLDLASYESVRDAATRILGQVRKRANAKPEDGDVGMPKGGRPWSKERIEKFEQWITDKFPRGGTPTS